MGHSDRRLVVFRNRLRPGVEEAYAERGEEIYALAEKMPGFVASKDFVAEDGERLAVIEFASAEDLDAWRFHPEHRQTQQRGRSRWYAEYSLDVCAVLRRSEFTEGEDPERLPDASPGPLERFTGEGGCACGAVRYRVDGAPDSILLCHCGDCRRAAGASPVAWATFDTRDVGWSGSAPKVRASSDRASRSFCAECGSQLAYLARSHPDRLVLTVATFDEPNRLPPRAHIFTRSKIGWVHLRDDLARHAEDLG